MIEFVDSLDCDLPNFLMPYGRFPKSFGRICCICGSDKTYIYKGRPIWARYRDDKGNITGEWACHKCQGKRKEDKIFKEITCRLCGSDKTRTQSNGKPIWIKDININKKFTGEFLCYKCAYEDNRPYCGHVNRIQKCYDNNGRWTGKRICKICGQFNEIKLDFCISYL